MNNKGAMKKGTFWFVLIGIFALVLVGAYVEKHYSVLPSQFSIIGTQSYASDCASVLNTYYAGAQPGECFMYGLNVNDRSYVRNPAYIYIVESAVQKEAKGCLGSGISPACPTGSRTYCTVKTTQSFADIMNTCKTAKSDFGTMVCDSTSHCNYANEVVTPDSCSPGDCLTLTSNTHATCLANKKYSGSLTGICPVKTNQTVIPVCPTGQAYNPTSKVCEANPTTTGTTGVNGVGGTTQTCQFYEKMNVSGTCDLNMNLIYIILGIVGIIVVLMLVKKK